MTFVSEHVLGIDPNGSGRVRKQTADKQSAPAAQSFF